MSDAPADRPAPLPWVQQPGPSTWGSAPSGPPAPVRGSAPSGRPRAGLALGLAMSALITSPFLGGLVLGVPALVVAVRARRRGSADGRTTAALAIATVALAVSLAFVLAVVRSEPFRDYVSCVRDAGGSAAAAEVCEDRLRAAYD